MNRFADPLHQESSVPMAQRFLMLEGKLAPALVEARIHRHMPVTLAAYRDRLTPAWHHVIDTYQSLQIPGTSRWVAVAFAYAHLPIGKTFDVLFPARRPEEAVQVSAVLMAIIDEWLPLPLPCIAAGHRSICLINFPTGVPRLIHQLPDVERFMQTRSAEHVWLSSQATWRHLVHQHGDG